jgi:uncharacterized protein YjbI with pentapeptide repeats
MVPLTLILLWARYLPRRDWPETIQITGADGQFVGMPYLFPNLIRLTVLHNLLIGLACGLAIVSYRLAVETVRQNAPAKLTNPFQRFVRNAKDANRRFTSSLVKRSRINARFFMWYDKLGRVPAFLTVSVLTTFVFCLLSEGAIHGVPDYLNPSSETGFLQREVPYAFYHMFATGAFVNFTQDEISTKPDSWNGTEIDKVKGIIFPTGANLKYLQAANAFLVKSDFNLAQLQHADFRQADLRRARFSGAHLEGAMLNDADIGGADFSKSYLSGVSFGGNLDKSNRFSQTDFSGADLSQASFRGFSTYSMKSWKQINLTKANFQETTVWGTDFTGADLTGVHLENAYCSPGELIYAYVVSLQKQPFAKASIPLYWKGTNFSYAKLDKARLPQGLRFADLEYAHLEGAIFAQFTHLDYAVLCHATLPKAHLMGVDLTGTFLSDVNLRGANLVNADFKDAHFDPDSRDAIELNRNVANVRFAAGKSVANSKEKKYPHYLRRSTPDFERMRIALGETPSMDQQRQKFLIWKKKSNAILALQAKYDIAVKIQGADLSMAQNLTWDQLQYAVGDSKTKLPTYLHEIQPAIPKTK